MENKKISFSTYTLLKYCTPLILSNLLFSRWGIDLPMLVAFYLLFVAIFHFVIVYPVGMFMKYEIENETITITNVLKKTTVCFAMQDDNLYVYKYSWSCLVLSYEPIVSKRDAKHKRRIGKAGFVPPAYYLRPAIDPLERKAKKL